MWRRTTIFCAVFLGAWAVMAGEVALPKAGDRVLFFGDSITFEGAYGRMVSQWLTEREPQRPIIFTARGRHGDNAEGGVKRIDSELVPWRPDWVFINFGINDARRHEPEVFLTHYEALLDAVTSATGARVAIVSPLYPDLDTPNPRLPGYVEGLKALAKKRGALYVPLYETMSRVRPLLPKGVAYAPDGVHPNVLGFAIMASAIGDAIGCPPGKESVELTIPDIRLGAGRKPLARPVDFTLPLSTPLHVVSVPWERPSVAIPRVAKAPKLDGDLSEWEGREPSLRLRGPEHLIVGIPSTESPLPQADVWLAADDQALYFAVRVWDNRVRHDDGAGIINRDGVEFMIDVRPSPQEATSYNSKTKGIAQFMLGARTKPGMPVEVGNGDASLAEGVEVATQEIPGGYVMEVRFPAAHFPQGKVTMPFGLDFSINDLDESDVYLSVLQLRWSGSNGSPFHTREWGVAIPQAPR